MKILSEMPAAMGEKWILCKYEDNLFAYGSEHDLSIYMKFPSSQCGSKEKVKRNCDVAAAQCKQKLTEYKDKASHHTNNARAWQLLLEHEQKKLEMLIEFSRVLSLES